MPSISKSLSCFVIQSRWIGTSVAAVGLLQASYGQANIPTHEALGQTPSYEVATIKPHYGPGFSLTLRMYILAAFGMQAQAFEQLIGPAWIDQKRYDIHGKPPDLLQDAVEKMSFNEKQALNRQMMQSLLEDRFKMKFHVETRNMPEYKLLVVKNGSKLKEDVLSNAGGKLLTNSSQTTIDCVAQPIERLINVLGNSPELAGYPVIDDTGLTKTYDFSLSWSPLGRSE